mgnify:CR=1 FL=1
MNKEDLINKYELMEYMHKLNYIVFQDGLEHSMQGIIERFEDE